MRKRGRPVGSVIRQNIAEMLYFRGKSYGYDLYKDYCTIFPKATLRVIYYNLAKGAVIGEFDVEIVHEEKGKYSWGSKAEKKYYKLGPNAKPRLDLRVKAFYNKK